MKKSSIKVFERRPGMLLLGWRISIAWDAVLAGDVESICEHVPLEEAAVSF
ncbi:hypothetical protein RISK_000398 [Rhodopirellula islandica]|uniref:Uncharacterized protein n=1 Tax=Rhodopirellula islandica TaxID=595434 RepID=A0A0J1BLJ0_RHOIS|nr:hypothetical protein [Rhodopirellula islandica]KLU07318.1 hypothetical protein RISK_000396 [Rhodopirellula islandica]KLU07320.1 hypothetical protein RISK_000398 [Rhodopirellula islandica]